MVNLETEEVVGGEMKWLINKGKGEKKGVARR